MTKARVVLATGLSMLALSGCGEERSDEPAEPESEVEEPAPDEGGDESGEAMEELRDGARSLSEGAARLVEEGGEAAERALEDARPTIERAGEFAGELGESVNQIIDQAQRDLEAFNQRIDEASSEGDDGEGAASGDPEATLPDESELDADTSAAARAGPADVGPDYVGVWAREAEACTRIDQENAPEIFAVVTPTTIRRYESVCNFETADLVEGSAGIVAECFGEGMSEERRMTFSMESPDALAITTGDTQVDLVRCNLPR